MRAVDRLLRRAQQAGAVRADVRMADLMALLVGVSKAIEHAGWDRGVQRRTMAILFDGLRAQRFRSDA
jgi:hypothetical protein